ncbi:MAG: T9SS type A sorting domain-containing protein [Bacteroidota bacterium]|nr:T9SS type A sorting domain-containing protein [Bacteroidota bacterium]
MKYINYLLLITTIFTVSSPAQTFTWKDINGPTGFEILKEGVNGKLFGVEGRNLFFSTNGGWNWEKMALPARTIYEFTNNKNLFLLSRDVPYTRTPEQVHLSTDNGETWNLILQTSDFSGYTSYKISDSGIVFGLNTIYGYRSGVGRYLIGSHLVRYNGQTWDSIGTLISNSYGASILWIDHANNFILDGGYRQGVLISTDYGVTWKHNLPARTVRDVCISHDNTIIIGASPTSDVSGGIFITTDQGRNWTNLGLSDKTISKIVCDSVKTIYTSTNKGIYRYDEKNEQWDYLGPTENYYGDLLLTKFGTLITTISTTGIYQSTDYGESWIANSPRNIDVLAVWYTHSGSILAGTLGNRLFKTTNNGVSWQQFPYGLVPNNIYSFNENNTTLYAGTDNGLYQSLDDGSTWTRQTNGLRRGPVYFVIININGTIYIGTDVGVNTSTDNGNSWVSSGLVNSKALFLARSNSGIVYVATDNDGVFKTTDDGVSWISCGLVRDDIQTISVNDAGDVYVGVFGGVFVSFDNGISWVSSQFTNTYVYSILCDGQNNVLAGTYNGLYWSTNNGQQWRAAGLQGKVILSMIMNNERNIIVGTYRNGVFQTVQAVTSIQPVNSKFPTSTIIYQNYPNPFNPKTELRFEIRDLSQVSIKIYDVLGHEVAILVNEKKQPGAYTVTWDVKDYPSGLYFARLIVNSEIIDMKKMLLVR